MPGKIASRNSRTMSLVTLPPIGIRNISLQFPALCDMTIHLASRSVKGFAVASAELAIVFRAFPPCLHG
jgi:hypothetical protein